MNIDENMVTAIVGGAMPFLVTLVVFGAPVLFFYLRWNFKLRDKELDLQRELALRGVGGAGEARGGEVTTARGAGEAAGANAGALAARRARIDVGPAGARVDVGLAGGRVAELGLGDDDEPQLERLLAAPGGERSRGD